jgi:CRISPR-associated endonuclease Cas2
MSKKYGTFLGDFLALVGEATGFFEWPMEYSESWRRKQLYQPRQKYYNAVSQAKRQGLIKEIRKQGKIFLTLTAKGELQSLVSKMDVDIQGKWDGKWRMVIFDIPEDARDKRDQLRWLLKKRGFIKLQASVFVNPYPLNREALKYLKQSGLMSYIRIAKIEEFDEDTDLRKKFKLPT